MSATSPLLSKPSGGMSNCDGKPGALHLTCEVAKGPRRRHEVDPPLEPTPTASLAYSCAFAAAAGLLPMPRSPPAVSALPMRRPPRGIRPNTMLRVCEQLA